MSGQFVSSEFRFFLSERNIVHMKSFIYYPKQMERLGNSTEALKKFFCLDILGKFLLENFYMTTEQLDV